MEYIIFGTTYGFSNTEATDAEQRFINQFYHDSTGEKTYIHKRYDNKVYYTRTIYGDKQHQFCDFKGRPGGFLGMLIGFDNHYCRDYQKVDRIFKNIYQQLIEAGYLKNNGGSHRFTIDDFSKYQQGIHQAVVTAVTKEGVKSTDLETFQFKDVKGVYRLNPADMPAYNQSVMKAPYNVEISSQYPLQEVLHTRKNNSL